MPNTKNIILENRKHKGLLAGAAGSGKSTFFATWPNSYFFDFDGGLNALAGRDNLFDIFPEPNIKIPTAYPKAEKILLALLESGQANGKIIYDEEKGLFVPKKVAEVKPPLRVAESLHLDGSTSFLHNCMYYSQFQRASAKFPAGRVPAEHDWYPQMEAYRRFVSKLLSAADMGFAHVWVATHIKIKEFKENGIVTDVENQPSITGKLATDIQGMFDFVWRIEADIVGGKRRTRLLTRSRGIVKCKCRNEEAFEMYEAPTYDNVIKKLNAFDAKKA